MTLSQLQGKSKVQQPCDNILNKVFFSRSVMFVAACKTELKPSRQY